MFTKILQAIKKFFSQPDANYEANQEFVTHAQNQIEDEKSKFDPKRIAIIVGHESKKQGMRIFNGMSEYAWNKEVAQIVLKKYNSRNFVQVFYRDSITIANLARQIKAWKADAIIELHLNAAGVPKARGCEVVVYKENKERIKLAEKFATMMLERFKIIKRRSNGVLEVSGKDRGAAILKAYHDAGTPIAMMVEPFFADFETNENKDIIANPEKYADALVEFVTGIL